MFKNSVTSKYQIVSDDLGFMSRKELQEKLPDLARAYEEAYENKKPDIKIIAAEVFSFPHEKYSMGSWHIIYAVLNGVVKQLPVHELYGKEQKLIAGSMILDCMVGNLNFCRLYVHPQDASPLLKEGEELSDSEWIALSCMSGLKSFAREKEYYNIKYPRDYSAQSKNPNEYKDTLKSLAQKGLIQLNAAGSAKLTLEGKNRAIQAGKVVRKYRGY